MSQIDRAVKKAHVQAPAPQVAVPLEAPVSSMPVAARRIGSDALDGLLKRAVLQRNGGSCGGSSRPAVNGRIGGDGIFDPACDRGAIAESLDHRIRNRGSDDGHVKGGFAQLQRMVNLMDVFGPNESVSQSGKHAYFILDLRAIGHVSIYSTNELTERQRKALLTQRRAIKKQYRGSNEEPPQAKLTIAAFASLGGDFLFDEFHYTTLNGTHFFYSDDGRILLKGGQNDAPLNDPRWKFAHRVAARTYQQMGLTIGMEQLEAERQRLIALQDPQAPAAATAEGEGESKKRKRSEDETAPGDRGGEVQRPLKKRAEESPPTVVVAQEEPEEEEEEEDEVMVEQKELVVIT